jgi:hypothetical protein
MVHTPDPGILGTCIIAGRSRAKLFESTSSIAKKCNDLPNVTDDDVINAFTCITMSEAFIHALILS